MTKMILSPVWLISNRILPRLWELILLFWKEKNGDQADLKITLDEFIDFHIEVATTHGQLTNQEILADINDDQVKVSDSEDDKSIVDEPVTKPGIEEARKSYSNSWEL